MERYEVLAPGGIRVDAGTLIRPTKEQIARRAHALRETGRKGVYELTAATQFKIGEVIEMESEVNKALLQSLGAPKAAKKEAPAKKKAEKKTEEKAEEIAPGQSETQQPGGEVQPSLPGDDEPPAA